MKLKGLKKLVLLVLVAVFSITIVSSAQSAPSIPAQQLSFGTGSTGGIYYPIGTGFAEVISSKVEPLNVTVEITGGSVENVRLVGEGEIDFGVCNSDNLAFGLAGTAPYTQSYEVSPICSILPSVFHIVTLEGSGVSSFEDLKGKKVACGPAGSSTITILEVVLAAHGMSMDDITPTYVGFDDGITQLNDGQVHAALVSSGYPTAAVLTLSATDKVVMVSLSQDKIDAIREVAPYYTPITVPADTYDMDADATTICVKNIVFCNSGLSEDTVYVITKTLFDNLEEFKSYHSGLAALTAKELADVGDYELHPGAKKYYDEAGL